jgi:hypothetical protein
MHWCEKRRQPVRLLAATWSNAFAVPPAPSAGDGAGILVAMPDGFLSSVMLEEQGIKLPPFGAYPWRGQARCLAIQMEPWRRSLRHNLRLHNRHMSISLV